ncbi:MAG: AMP-binding protein [Gammaproteobacteria bacterium]
MSVCASLPLVSGAPLEAPIVRHAGSWITRAEYLAHAEAFAAALPAGRYCLNLCVDRYHFLVAFAALLIAGRVNLLPHSVASGAIAELGAEYGAFRIEDDDVQVVRPGRAVHASPEVPADREAAVLFTSGSTGRPGAQIKRWGELVGSARAAIARFGFAAHRHDIVATVPAQHSYGFESSVLYALHSPAVVHAGRPLFPADVRAALVEMQAPRVLVTTPLHLDACLRAGLDWPALAFALSATAPLTREIAVMAENSFAAPMLEIYGSSETGAIASRRTTSEAAWKPYEGVRVYREGERFRVAAPFLPEPRALADRFALGADGCFEWRGRREDQVKIAGKRTTLSELNRRLLAVAGVEDGGFILPAGKRRRMAAVVVAPTLSPREIRERLAESLDSVFLPRPLVMVPELKRTETGKLARGELLARLANYTRRPERRSTSTPDTAA